MIIVGISSRPDKHGEKTTTLHVVEEFTSYDNAADEGRSCAGQKVDSIYAANYDCSDLKISDEIEVIYLKAIRTKNGIYQPVKRIDVISE